MRFLLLPLILLLTGPAFAEGGHAQPFSSEADARAEVEAAIARAEENGTRALLVFGANWCHDSIGLSDHFAQDDMQEILFENFELVLVDVGWRDRNLDIARDYGAWTIYGTPTVLIVDPELGLINADTMHTWHWAYSRPHDDVVRYFRQMAFVRPGGGVVENTRTYAGLESEIAAWEAREGARLTRAYATLQEWQASLAWAFEAAGNDEEATRLVELYHSVEADIDHHRGRMREDRNALYSQARELVRDAILDQSGALTPEAATALDAASPELHLDFPDYGPVLFPWEDEGWSL
ncbi:thioredoxin family protein [Hyphobacterium sp. HN65]|uniref:Thioredoxin family protein n=1 Tax=Hyphobacterium lacteum TaxID=3116575 RepID=A0ABU7LPY9_9PROT|nr:thioredoxin family protein [Hyphobacterium sp. HN65]MEE2525967.1 thioredoxin family protein [Hyphobacterium sp. HN65]